MKTMMIRLRNRKTPKGQIECPIGDTVKPSFCKEHCTYASKCPSYFNYVNRSIWEKFTAWKWF